MSFNKLILNQQAQVQKNLEDIEDLKELNIFINGLGIKVLGRVITEQDIPEDEYEYGDAYLVGATTPYDLYVWTRAELGSDWINLGNLAVVGPQGEQGPEGPEGPQGIRGSMYFTGSIIDPTGTQTGDLYLITSGANKGNLYKKDGTNSWVLQTNIMGPQGIQGNQGPKGNDGEKGEQGPKGETGDVGGSINILGVYSQSSLLPDPATLHNLTYAALVGTQVPYDLYVQVGESSATAVWYNQGPFNAATLLYSGTLANSFNVYDIDQKLTVKTDGGSYVYTHTGATQSQQAMVSNSATPSSVAQRTSGGQVKVATPSVDEDAANKGYVDTNFLAKTPSTSTSSYASYVYGKNSTGDPYLYQASTATFGYSIVQRDAVGRIVATDPANNNEVATKGYVDSKSGGGRIGHHIKLTFTNPDSSETCYIMFYWEDKTNSGITSRSKFFSRIFQSINDVETGIPIAGYMGQYNPISGVMRCQGSSSTIDLIIKFDQSSGYNPPLVVNLADTSTYTFTYTDKMVNLG